MESSSQKEFDAFVHSIGGIAPFKPCAEYHKTLDMILVSLRDCSVTSVPMSDYIEVLLDNHPENGESEFAGFSIHRVENFIKKYLDYDTKHKISAILKSMELIYSPSIFGKYRNEIKDAWKHFPLEVDIAEQ